MVRSQDGSLGTDDERLLTTCPNCFGCKVVPDIFGDYVLCEECSVLPRDPLWTSGAP